MYMQTASFRCHATRLQYERTKFLWQAVCYERIGFCNYADSTRHFRIDIGFGGDFRDLFEVRGSSRKRRGTCTSVVTEDGAEFHYEGLDNLNARQNCDFGRRPLVLRQIARRSISSLRPMPAGRSSCRFFARTGTSRCAIPSDMLSGRGGAPSGALRPASRRSKVRTNFSMKSAGGPRPISTCS